MCRIVYVSVSYFILWNTSTLNEGFFPTLLVFLGGMLCDYWALAEAGYELNIGYQKKLGVIGLFISILYILVCFLGIQGIIGIKNIDNIFYISTTKSTLLQLELNLINCILIPLGIFIILSGFEIFNEHKRLRSYNKNAQHNNQVQAGI